MTRSAWVVGSPSSRLMLGPLVIEGDRVAVEGPKGSVVFATDGIRFEGVTSRENRDQVPWSQIAGMGIALPIEPRWAWFLIGTFNTVNWRGYIEHGDWAIEVGWCDAWENGDACDLGRPERHFSRPARAALDEAILMLGRERTLPALASAEFMRDVLARLPTSPPRREPQVRETAREAVEATLSTWNVGVRSAALRFPETSEVHADRQFWSW